MPIKAIIWDMGGVLIRTADFGPRQKLAEEYGMTIQEIDTFVFGSEENNLQQLGKISYAEHWANIGQKLGLDSESVKAFEEQFFAGDVLDTHLLDTIRQHRNQGYHTTLLSNALSNLREKVINDWQAEDAFVDLVISAEEGMMKPDPAIYHLTLERIGVSAKESVFIDDMPRNIQAARAVEMHGIVFKTPEQTLKELEKLLGDTA